ncbi:MAG TPA: ankyrin repeat domain-containing protein [Thermoanaerobaculia bacterium]|nr:ankyrin repeat domain-containing protein [Thermoanaerobaculia bacterium]
MLKIRSVELGLALFLLLSWSASAQDPGDELRRAAGAGDVAKVKELLDKGTDVNAANTYGGTALAFACDRGHLEVVKLLLDRGANPNTEDTFYKAKPVTWAAQKGHLEILKLLLDRGVTPDPQILMMGIYGEQPAIVKLMLERTKPEASALTDSLAIAEQVGNPEIVEILKAAGAKPPAPANFEVDAATLKSYEGTYEGEGGLAMTVALKDGKLTAAIGGGTFTLGAVDKVTFRPNELPGGSLVFQVQDGKVAGVDLVQAGTIRPLKKKEVAQ